MIRSNRGSRSASSGTYSVTGSVTLPIDPSSIAIPMSVDTNDFATEKEVCRVLSVGAAEVALVHQPVVVEDHEAERAGPTQEPVERSIVLRTRRRRRRIDLDAGRKRTRVITGRDRPGREPVLVADVRLPPPHRPSDRGPVERYPRPCVHADDEQRRRNDARGQPSEPASPRSSRHGTIRIASGPAFVAPGL